MINFLSLFRRRQVRYTNPLAFFSFCVKYVTDHSPQHSLPYPRPSLISVTVLAKPASSHNARNIRILYHRP